MTREAVIWAMAESDFMNWPFGIDKWIEASLRDMVDVMNFQKITGRRLSEANLALAFGEIEIKETDR